MENTDRKLVHEFTEDERRVVATAQAQFFNVVKVIVDLHQLKGNLSLSPDGRGLIEQPGAKP